MKHEIDADRLREDMKDLYGTAMTAGFPMAMADLSEVERASDRELADLAREHGVDLSKYSR